MHLRIPTPPASPLPEAYSRVSHPERFAPLHDLAVGLLDRLEAEFQVQRVDDPRGDELLDQAPLVQRAVQLRPDDPEAASLTIAFTTFPGLLLRFGRRGAETFPACGCDACAETAEEEGARLEWIVAQVTAGRFQESIRIPLIGEARTTEILWAPDGSRSENDRPISRKAARADVAGGRPRVLEWRPWSPR